MIHAGKKKRKCDSDGSRKKKKRRWMTGMAQQLATFVYTDTAAVCLHQQYQQMCGDNARHDSCGASKVGKMFFFAQAPYLTFYVCVFRTWCWLACTLPFSWIKLRILSDLFFVVFGLNMFSLFPSLFPSFVLVLPCFMLLFFPFKLLRRNCCSVLFVDPTVCSPYHLLQIAWSACWVRGGENEISVIPIRHSIAETGSLNQS